MIRMGQAIVELFLFLALIQFFALACFRVGGYRKQEKKMLNILFGTFAALCFGYAMSMQREYALVSLAAMAAVLYVSNED